ncbi:hypothetical protein [Parasediminibacterium sp. JCM 36343]|uniref:hypothetical protein n=1 Tax=Parasediminibacterium sp. JCM 36343 TaxID=3374279 RepID=UPI00397A157E
MDFIDVGYAYLAPILLLALLFGKPQYPNYIKSILATLNICLLFFFINQCREYYGLYQFAKAFGMEVSIKSLLRLFSTNIPYAVKNLLLWLTPLCFISRKLDSSTLLSIFVVLLLWWDVLYGMATRQVYTIPGAIYNTALCLALRFICLVVGMYALLWLWKKLPHQA